MRPTVERVDHGPDAEALAERDPEQQHEQAEQDDDGAEAQAGVVGDALVQHVVRAQAELGLDHHRDPDAERERARRSAAGSRRRSSAGPGKPRTVRSGFAAGAVAPGAHRSSARSAAESRSR